MSDVMWKNFAPLWNDLRKLSHGLLLTGGYALFLKQKWLIENRDVKSVVGIEIWPDSVPRATKDFDVIVCVKILADATLNSDVAQLIEKHEFTPWTKFWKFKKGIGDDNHLILELHAFPDKNANVKVEGNRVKGRNVGKEGIIHGRENPEAAGSNISPFSFSIDGADIVVPNAVSFAIMKLTAMRDRWLKTKDESLNDEEGVFHRTQSIKHAKDVFRAVAMMTNEEYKLIPETLVKMKEYEVFRAASGIFKEFFIDGDTPGSTMVSSDWSGENYDTVLSLLRSWFIEK